MAEPNQPHKHTGTLRAGFLGKRQDVVRPVPGVSVSAYYVVTEINLVLSFLIAVL